MRIGCGLEAKVDDIEDIRLASVETSIFGRPRPRPGDRHAVPSAANDYTLIREEPLHLDLGEVTSALLQASDQRAGLGVTSSHE